MEEGAVAISEERESPLNKKENKGEKKDTII